MWKRCLSIILMVVLLFVSVDISVFADSIKDTIIEISDSKNDIVERKYDQSIIDEGEHSVSQNSKNNEETIDEENSLMSGTLEIENVLYNGNTTSTYSSGSYYWPVPSCRTMSRGYSSNHDAIDIAAGIGNAVYATKAGTIKHFFNSCEHTNSGQGHNCNDSWGCGNGLYILHDDGTWAEYAHMQLNSFPSSIKTGARVSQGQYLGNTGSSGVSEGPHLHFGIKQGSTSFWSSLAVNNNPDVISYVYDYVGDGSDPASLLTNTGVTNVTDTTAKINAKLPSVYNISEAGFYYGTSPDNMTKVVDEDDSGETIKVFFTLGDGSNCQALTPGTKYYYQLYVIINGVKHKSEIDSFTTTGNAGHNPIGNIETVTVKPGCIELSGWAYDEDDLAQSIYMHMYIGEEKPEELIASFKANIERTDVGKHGFAYGVYTNYSGTKNIYVYGINIGGGSNNLIGSRTVDIPVDTEKPIISEVEIIDFDINGYTVRCKVTDNVKIDRVQFPTWTADNGQDDIFNNWQYGSEASGTKDGDYYTYRVNRSDHNDEYGRYHTHIYAYDLAGNHTFGNISFKFENNLPEISDVYISDETGSGYTITCTVTDESGIDRVQFPTWTSYNGQDDLVGDYWPTNPSITGTKNGDKYSFRVEDSEHNYERGKYITHIYAYDKLGNTSQYNLSYQFVNQGISVGTVSWNGHTYQVIDDKVTWNEAKEICEKNGGHLAVITSQEEQNTIESIIPTDTTCGGYFIGGYSEEGVSRWVTNESFEYTNWYPGEPNNGNEGTEDVYEMYLDGLWNDCRKEKTGCGYICEYAPEAELDFIPPEISDIKITDVNGNGFTVVCTVTDNKNVERVQFPIWTRANGQDDLLTDWEEDPNASGIRDKDVFSFRVEDSVHNYERGEYIIHIWAYDKFGNETCYELEYDFQNQESIIGETNYKGNIYRVFDDKVSWVEAKQLCENMGGHLVTITSVEELNAIINMLQNNGKSKAYYIGGHIENNEFKWVTEESFEYVNWDSSVQNDGEDTKEFCEMYLNGFWNTCENNANGRGYICEYEVDDVFPEDIPDEGVPEELWISGLVETGYIYTGNTIKPIVRIYDRYVRLQEGVDYTITYKNNVKANNASNEKTAPTIVIKGKGNYSGEVVAYFKILPKNFADEDILSQNLTTKYNGRIQKKIPTVTWNGKKLRNKLDYTVEYPDMEENANAYKEPGDYNILIKGIGNYTGEKLITITITENELISKAYVTKIADQMYTGNAIEPALSVRHGLDVLERGVDYTVEYKDNVDVGTATATITGIGTYSGTKTVSFKIIGTSIASAKITGMPSSFIYSGSAITTDSDIWEEEPVLTVLVGKDEYTLVEGSDYDISYRSNTDKGTAVIQFAGKGAYTGKLTKTFRILAYDIVKDESEQMTLYLEMDSYEYEKGGNRPKPVVMFGNTVLTEKKDYTLSYRNNYKVNDGSDVAKAPTVIIKGKGNFSGSKELTFAITNNDLSDLIMNAEDKVFLEREDAHESEPVIVTQSGQKLKKGQDYEETLTYCYKEETTLEDGTVREAGAVVEKDDIVPVGTTLEVIAIGKGNYEGLIKSEYRIVKYDISKASITIPKQDYTGEAITLDKSEITVKLGDTVLNAEDYEIVSYQDNIDRGRAKVTIRGVGEYGGTRTVKFTIKSKLLEWWEGVLNYLFG